MRQNLIPIAVFTGSRAEYGLLRHLIKNLDSEPSIDLQLIVSGAHLSNTHGLTVCEINQDGIKPKALVPLSLDEKFIPSMSSLTAEALKGVGEVLENLQPKALIVLGDRYETFAAASAAHLQGIPVIHLHGGEATHGALDDRLRHAISQLSTWHFTAAEPYRECVIAMGAASERVFQVGPMAIDGLLSKQLLNRSEFESRTGYLFNKSNLLVTYHPETLLKDKGIEGFRILLEALEMKNCNILFTQPNADDGGTFIETLLDDFVMKYPKRSWKFASLGQELYHSALHLFEAMAGNSSSGLIEAPLIGLPVVNIGNRQSGRLRQGNIFDIPDPNLIVVSNGIRQALKEGTRSSWPRPGISKQLSPSKSIIEWLKNQKSKGYN